MMAEGREDRATRENNGLRDTPSSIMGFLEE
jgi:hypothetical protein